MIVIINRKNSNNFVLSNDFKVELKKDIPFVISEENYKLLLKEYGCFFNERIISGNNSIGCFEVIEDNKTIKKEEVKEEKKEYNINDGKTFNLEDLSYKQLIELAKEKNIKLVQNIKKIDLIKILE